jgi:hypothetical protein
MKKKKSKAAMIILSKFDIFSNIAILDIHNLVGTLVYDIYDH